ncbi:unnamed protein product, partial [Phaeothamnion confervicola]
MTRQQRFLVARIAVVVALFHCASAFVQHHGPKGRLSAQTARASSPRYSRMAVTTPDALQLLEDVSVFSAATGESMPLTKAWDLRPRGEKTIVSFLTHFADFNSWELAQKLRHNLPAIDDAGTKVVAVGIGSILGAKAFAAATGFPLGSLYVDESANAYSALNFAQGFQPKLPGKIKVNPYLRLLPMLAGIGSPGTIQAVLRGYTGDRSANAEWVGTTLQIVDKSAFDVLGTDGARPLEVATVRLQNMAEILRKWDVLSPPNKELITQQGGTLVFDGAEVIYEYRDKGILTYCDVDVLMDVVGARR